ncbi:death-on-curing protein [Treponema pedis]|uniref:Death-on-curing protein n=1 Tax=Treponema pedis TaxID=409322 RepID=A0A7S6WQ91_9SPIR|nr:death-on-curing protein [Treponema pedis]QOW61343.1 death-on-curing protein [Treponema pedis]
MNEIQFLLYNTPDGGANVQVAVKDETIWMTQKAMSRLFDCSADNIGLHLKNIFQEGELTEQATAEKISVVQKEGTRNVNRELIFYNLDAIISGSMRFCPTRGVSPQAPRRKKQNRNIISSIKHKK